MGTKIIVCIIAWHIATISWSMLSIIFPFLHEISIYDSLGLILIYKGFEYWFKKL